MPSARANEGQGGGAGRDGSVWEGGGRHAGWLVGWSAELLLGWGVPQACGYIHLGFPFALARALSFSL